MDGASCFSGRPGTRIRIRALWAGGRLCWGLSRLNNGGGLGRGEVGGTDRQGDIQKLSTDSVLWRDVDREKQG